MDREQFLTWSESVLEPCAVPGARPGGATPYRTVRIAPWQYLGVDALNNGTLRVYLYSTHATFKTRWMRLRNTLEVKEQPSHLNPLPPDSRSRLFMRDNGEAQRGFFGFEWRPISEDLSPERAPLSQYVEWLLHVCRKG
ncbi:hypothetical protein [Vitiosangium sp. GDMCC 1.1324]|uniref:hypothetical protein n=1 Tax=Vitiosangium sp. (strain GDMCC 1.1324) TaxID=2138576 RepID=UPI000D3CB7BB|nr:hypothetical protein [Vitiosangium sp. GDMCC 1.1324]PTL83758.1 hypothetical protein DAT35_09795 [Vitiosangium sp. GDMCC 1.1324]